MKVYPIVTKDGIRDSGIDLRDYIAISAMNGMLSADKTLEWLSDDRSPISEIAYDIADEMLSQRALDNGEG